MSFHSSCLSQRWLIMTDLDGTLLDHNDYNYDAVKPVLAELSSRGISVVANTSKTRAEWLSLRKGLHNTDAFVVENGSAVYFPDGGCEILGTRREEILEFLADMRKTFSFEGFADGSVEDVVKNTGLLVAEARLAMDREYSEPLIWKDSSEAKAAFVQCVKEQGLQTLEGGRFTHVLGMTDKGQALDVVRDFYSAETVVALGDSPNDAAMLQRADVPVLIRNPSKIEEMTQKLSSLESLRMSDKTGPEGWAEEITTLLSEIPF